MTKPNKTQNGNGYTVYFQVRGDIIQAVRAFPVESVGALSQNNEIMRTALLVPHEVEVEPLVSVSVIQGQM